MQDAKTEQIDMIVLRLAGPFQAWGNYATGDTREITDVPSKSGIVGLIACAMGLDRNDKKIQELSEAIRIGVRVDREGRLNEDYQTITTAMQANGKIRTTPIVSRRTYIEDGCFTVFVTASEEWLSAIEVAFHAPKWPVYLGRANCVPSEPVFRCRTRAYADIEDAILKYPLWRRTQTKVDRSRRPVTIKYEIEARRPEYYSYTRSDVRAPGKRNFATRRVWRNSFTVCSVR